MVKSSLTPATKTVKREVYRRIVMMKAEQARTIVISFLVSALKKSAKTSPLPALRKLARTSVTALPVLALKKTVKTFTVLSPVMPMKTF